MPPVAKKATKPAKTTRRSKKGVKKPVNCNLEPALRPSKRAIFSGTSEGSLNVNSAPEEESFAGKKKFPWSKPVEDDADEAPEPKRPKKSESEIIAISKKAFAQLDSKADRQRAATAKDESDSDEDDNVAPLLNTARGKKRSVLQSAIEYDSDDDEEDSEDDGSDNGDEEADDSEDEDEKGVQQKLSDMTMAQIKKLKDKLGLKIFNKMYFESGEDEPSKPAESDSDDKDADMDAATDSDNEAPEEQGSKKKSRHAPREMSSKHPVSVYRQIDPNAVNYERRRQDPRFDRRAGEFNEGEFRRDYGFIDELAHNDIKRLKAEHKTLRKRGDTRSANALRERIRQLENRQTAVEERDIWRQTTREVHETNIERMNAGLKPKFVSNSALKAKFQEKKLARIEKTGNIKKYLRNKERREEKKKLM
uniref:rRNA biogenesis protein RRP36 n=1 Tax=Panagrellus redivivus TaxID=6233 RepID=A0A7E4UPZ7_PANRE